MEFESHRFYAESELQITELIELKIDSVNWRIYLTDGNDNYIRFMPYSEYHGGGEPFFINIGNSDFEEWINRNDGFERKIRKLLDERKRK